MKRRDLIWLLVVLATAALWTRAQRPGPAPSSPAPAEFQLVLVLASDAQLQNSFTLTLKSTAQGASHDTLLHLPGLPPPWDTHGLMTREAFDRLWADLEQAGLWSIGTADSGEPEDQVLYTRLTVSQGERKSVSEWRGIPSDSHKRLVGCFLQSVLGPSIQGGLKKIQAFKAKPGGSQGSLPVTESPLP